MSNKTASIFWLLSVTATFACFSFPSASAASPANNQPSQTVAQSYKQAMIQAYETGNYTACTKYGIQFINATSDRSSKALACYYCGNSQVKLHSDPMYARYWYYEAVEWANEKTDKVLIDDCNRAAKALEAIDPTAGPLRETLTSTTPQDNAAEAMAARVRDQRLRSAGSIRDGEQPCPDPTFNFFLQQKSRQESNLLMLKSQKQTEATIAAISSQTMMLNSTLKQLDDMMARNPQLRAWKQKMDQWDADAKEALDRGPGLNTEPKLQTVGTDYYTKVYGTAASQTVPKPADPNELVATEERMVLDAHSVPGKTISRIVKVPIAPKPANADLNVHGNLVPEATEKSTQVPGKNSQSPK